MFMFILSFLKGGCGFNLNDVTGKTGMESSLVE